MPGRNRGFQEPTVAEFYSAGADVYREMWAPELLPLARLLLPRLPLEQSELVLEVGAGVGTLLPEIQSAAPRSTIVGVDIAEGMISLAPAEFPRAVMDAARLGLREDAVDVAILAFCLFHIPQPESALKEVRGVLREGGKVGTVTWGYDPSYLAMDIWNDELEAEGVPLMPSLARHELVDSEEKVEALFRTARLTPEETWSGIYDKTMTPDEFLEHRTRHGMARYRYEQLEPERRESFLERVRARIGDLNPEGLRIRAEVIYVTGHR